MLLIIDNYDSFTYNLVHYCMMAGAEAKTVRNDAITIDSILEDTSLSGVLISPGPCSPDEAGISLPLISAIAGKLPMLGVCLGHEALMQAFGGDIIRVPPVHGKTSAIMHDESCPLFKNIPSSFRATRYHSLAADEATLPDCLTVTARAEHSENGLIMALRHRTYPMFGVQFHPESIASEYGHQLIQNFLHVTDTTAHPRKD